LYGCRQATLEHVARQSCGSYKDANEKVSEVQQDQLEDLIRLGLRIDFIDGDVEGG
jgi:hypothetical protein